MAKEGPPLLWQNTNMGVSLSGFSIMGAKLFTMGVREVTDHLFPLDASA